MPSEDGAFLNPTTLREITILKKLKGHPNIVTFIDCRVPDLSETEGGCFSSGGDAFAMMNNSPMTYMPASHHGGGQADPADKRAVWLIMEYVETDLGRFMKNPQKEWAKGGVPKGLPMDMVKSFFFQILCGLAYCHANLVLHRDLKPCNILVTETGRIKITDFGLGRTYNVPMPPYSPGVVTLMYRAPEICLSLKNYTPAIDVWSAGCIFAEMLSGRILFNGNHAQASNDFDLLITIFRILGVPTEEVWPGLDDLIPGDAEQGYARTFLLSQRRANYAPRGLAKCVATSGVSDEGMDLLSRLLFYNPSKRLTAQAALKHPFLQGVAEEVYSPEERDWLKKAMELEGV
ncbi:kinase-like domain-containing protein [Hyaloraphidium curvatum]|nr:kinase-like domain-containing protein [Hyaloraphidium curvatum]